MTGSVPAAKAAGDGALRIGEPTVTKGALRQRRYKQRKREAASPSSPDQVTRLTLALSDLVDLLGTVTPAEVAEVLDDITALGVADDARIASAWLSCLEFIASRRAKP